MRKWIPNWNWPFIGFLGFIASVDAVVIALVIWIIFR